MLKEVNASGALKVKIFSGNPAKVETDIAAFLEQAKVKVHGFAQSQSTMARDSEVNVTTTLLYTLYNGHEEKIGFNR